MTLEAAALSRSNTAMTEQVIYKIAGRAEWAAAEAAGVYRGSADDARDGYIHFSTAAQLRATAAKHFAGRDDLLLIAVNAADLGPALRWEPSRKGALFPHLYADLAIDAALWRAPLPLGSDGVHRFPERLDAEAPSAGGPRAAGA